MAAERARAMADIPSFVRAALGYEDALYMAGVPPSIATLMEADSVVAPDDDRLRCQILTRLRTRTPAARRDRQEREF